MVCTYRHFAPGAKQAASAYAAHLLEKTVASDRMAQAVYYTQGQEVPAEWAAEMGSIPLVRADLDAALADALSIQAGAVLNPEQLANILGGRRADGDEIERGKGQHTKVRTYEDTEGGAMRHRIAGTDFTFSASKGLSVAWALAGTDAERWSLLQAHRDAVTETLHYMEREIAWAGFGEGHRQGGVEPGRLAWIPIEHFTARPTIELTRPDPETGVIGTEIYSVQAGDKVRGDPQIHTHVIVPNLMVTESGRLIAVNRDKLEGRIHEFGAVYHAMLAKNLRTLGVDVGLCPRTLTSRLAAIPEAICQAFSKRSTDGTAAARAFAKENGLDWDTMSADLKVALLKSGTQSHKLPKDFALTPQQRKDYENSSRKDDLADFDAWAQTAERLGFKHETVITYGPPAPIPEDAVRAQAGHEAAAPILETELDKRAVVRVYDARIAAARGLIASGAKDAGDVDRVLRLFERDGVKQQGRWTRLLTPAGTRNAQARVTTVLHRDQEQEVIGLVRAAAEDKSFALTPETLRRVTAGHDFTTKIGGEQKRAIGKVGVGGAVSVFIGVGGSGKTTKVLPPLVTAYRDEGREVWGVAQAWRQAGALAEGGIDPMKTFAMQPFLSGLQEGAEAPLAMKPGSVVVVDELSQIGTRELLDLLRAQARHGFKIVLTGDERQCASISAGPIIELLAEALGAREIPEILTIMRQSSEREQEIASLFRGERGDGPKERLAAVMKAVDMKRQDGTAELVPGGRDEIVKRSAEAFMEAVTRNHNDPEYKVTISAPTNADAMDISLAIRGLRKQAGQVGADQAVVPGMDGAGNRYEMALAPGDRIRLFRRTHAKFMDERGYERSAIAGNNGTVLTVRRVVDERVTIGRKVVDRAGVEVETPGGKVGFIPWEKLRAKGTTRVQLAYGDCLTIDSSQGITSHEHINALPGGSRSVQGFKNYVASSRHRVRSLLLSSAGAELRQVDEARPGGVPVSKDWAVRESEAWDNLIANMARQPVKETAMQLLAGAIQDTRQSVRALQKHLRAAEARERAGLAPTTLRDNLDQTETARQLALALGDLATEVRATATAVQGAPPPPITQGDVDVMIQAEAKIQGTLVAVGHLPFSEAIDRVADAVRGQLADKPEMPWTPERAEWVMARAEHRLAEGMIEFEATIDQTARRQALDRMEARLPRHEAMVAAGLWNEARVIQALVRDEAKIQSDPAKVAYPLSDEALGDLARPVAAKLFAVRRIAPAIKTPPAGVAAGAVRTASKQRPRLGA